MVLVDQLSQRLDEFSSEINACIDKADWEMLTAVLISRQSYLEQISAESVPETQRPLVRQFLEKVLQDDAVFQSKIQDQKIQLSELQVLLEKGRRAVHAYNNH